MAGLDVLDLDRFTIVGRYARFDPELRASLDELRQRLVAIFGASANRPENFLVWGPPGSGKSYLIQQIAETLPAGTRFVELNLARLGEEEFGAILRAAWQAPGPLLCFVDEVDAKADTAWPYELLLSFLEPPVPRPSTTGFVLAGSGGSSRSEMRQFMVARPKGRDLLSRIPVANEYEVRPLGTGDRVLVAAVQFVEAARVAGHPLRDIEKFALYYVASNPDYSSARQLRALADQSAQRIPGGETRLRYDHLFRPGDLENKEFWSRAKPASAPLVGAYVRIRAADPARPAGVGVVVTPRPTSRSPEKRVAVLPFRNISPDPADSYLAEGFTEEITSTLAAVPGLEVVPRASTLRYRSRGDKGAAEIASELNAVALLDGSVRKAGARLRITAEFIEPAMDRQAWTETFDGAISDLFQLQTEIAGRVARAFRSGIGEAASTRTPPTTSMDAYLLLLKGRAAYREATREGLERAIGLYGRALEADPHFAEALAGIAAAYRRIGFWMYRPSAEALAVAKQYAERALAENPALTDAHLTLAALFRSVDHDLASAEREVRAVLEHEPRNGYAHAALGAFLLDDNRLAEARKEAQLALELDPESSDTIEHAGVVLLYARQTSEAAAALHRALQLEPQNNSARHNLGLALIQSGSFDEGVALMEGALEQSATPSPIQLMELGYGHLRAGHLDRARSFLDRIVSETGSTPGFWGAAAGLYANLGRTDEAFAAIDRALDAQAAFLTAHLRCDFIFDPLRSDPRFSNVLLRIGSRQKPPETPVPGTAD